MKFLVIIGLIIASSSLVDPQPISNKEPGSSGRPHLTKLHQVPNKDKRGVHGLGLTYGHGPPGYYSPGPHPYQPLTVSSPQLQSHSLHGSLDSSALTGQLQLLPVSLGGAGGLNHDQLSYAQGAPTFSVAGLGYIPVGLGAESHGQQVPIQAFGSQAPNYHALQLQGLQEHQGPHRAPHLQFHVSNLKFPGYSGSPGKNVQFLMQPVFVDESKIGPIQFEQPSGPIPPSLVKPQSQFGFKPTSLSLSLPATTYGAPSHSSKIPYVSGKPSLTYSTQLQEVSSKVLPSLISHGPPSHSSSHSPSSSPGFTLNYKSSPYKPVFSHNVEAYPGSHGHGPSITPVRPLNLGGSYSSSAQRDESFENIYGGSSQVELQPQLHSQSYPQLQSHGISELYNQPSHSQPSFASYSQSSGPSFSNPSSHLSHNPSLSYSLHPSYSSSSSQLSQLSQLPQLSQLSHSSHISQKFPTSYASFSSTQDLELGKPGTSYSPRDPSTYEKQISASLGLEKGFAPIFPPGQSSHTSYSNDYRQSQGPSKYELSNNLEYLSDSGYKSSGGTNGNISPPPYSVGGYDDYSSHNSLSSEYESSDSSLSKTYAFAPGGQNTGRESSEDTSQSASSNYDTISYSGHVEPIKDITTSQ